MHNRIAQDIRIDPRLRVALGAMEPPHLPKVESREKWLASFGDTPGQIADLAPADPAPYEQLAPSTWLNIRRHATTSSPDGNTINVCIIRPRGTGALACLYYMHCGGANPAPATAISLNLSGDIGLVSGIYVVCPYLAGGSWRRGAVSVLPRPRCRKRTRRILHHPIIEMHAKPNGKGASSCPKLSTPTLMPASIAATLMTRRRAIPIMA